MKTVKHALIGLALLFSVGCGAGVKLSAAHVASGIEAAKDLYIAACTHEPVSVPKNVCEAGKAGINDVIDFYSEVNDQLPE